MSKKENRWLVLTATALTFSFFCRARAQTRAEHQTDSKPQVSNSSVPKHGPVKSMHDPTIHWQELENKWGWTIRFPRDWKAWAFGDETPETGNPVNIEAPNGCPKRYVNSGGRCATIQVDLVRSTPDQLKLSPQQFSNQGKNTPGIITQREVVVGGSPGYEVIYLATNMGGWPHGKPSLQINVRHGNDILEISYSEDAIDNAPIRGPSDWKFRASFDKILPTFTFTSATCRVGPCR